MCPWTLLVNHRNVIGAARTQDGHEEVKPPAFELGARQPLCLVSGWRRWCGDELGAPLPIPLPHGALAERFFRRRLMGDRRDAHQPCPPSDEPRGFPGQLVSRPSNSLFNSQLLVNPSTVGEFQPIQEVNDGQTAC